MITPFEHEVFGQISGQTEPMDMENASPKEQSIIILDSDEELEETTPEIIDLAEEDEDNGGTSEEETLQEKAKSDKQHRKTSRNKLQHPIGLVMGHKQSKSSITNQSRPIEVDLSESLDEVKLVSDDKDEPEVLVAFERLQASAIHPVNATSKGSEFFSLISWNIDGLENDNLENRIKGVVRVIQKEEPDIVYLQEVVPLTLAHLKEHLPQYKLLPGGSEGYFTATLLKLSRVKYDSHVILPFDNTLMDRNLLYVQVHVGGVKFNLLNSHLESMKEFAVQRKAQMKICFEKMLSFSSSDTTIFGGDLNARDKEINATKPSGVLDLWEVCGGRHQSRWTWNMAENTNKQIPNNPKCRFDRLYLKHSSPAHIAPEEFRLVGKEKVAGMPCFPSDHWGIFVRFKIPMIRSS